jgi:transcriptional regulator with XRE-family HTH domain
VDTAHPPGSPWPGLNLGAVETVEDFARALRRVKVRAERTGNRKLTCRRLAEITGYSHSTISTWLSGKSLPPADKLDDLLDALGATPDERSLLATKRDDIDDLRRDPAPARPEPVSAVQEPAWPEPARWPKLELTRGAAIVVVVGLAAAGFLAGKAGRSGDGAASPGRQTSPSTGGPAKPSSPGPAPVIPGVMETYLYTGTGMMLGVGSAGQPDSSYDLSFRATSRSAVLEFLNGSISFPSNQALSYQACTIGTRAHPDPSIVVPLKGAIICYDTQSKVVAIRIIEREIGATTPYVKLECETWRRR